MTIVEWRNAEVNESAAVSDNTIAQTSITRSAYRGRDGLQMVRENNRVHVALRALTKPYNGSKAVGNV